jgi:uncharacterized membrane protein YdjX (TVP38/TMEM64 family)
MKHAGTEGQRGAVWRRAAFLALLCIALALLARSADVHSALIDVLEASREVIVARPVTGALLFVLLAAVSAMFAFVSIAVVIPLAVYVWGTAASLLLLWTGWLLGGAAAYAIARSLGRHGGDGLPRRRIRERQQRHRAGRRVRAGGPQRRRLLPAAPPPALLKGTRTFTIMKVRVPFISH